jgi:hypothetical protein
MVELGASVGDPGAAARRQGCRAGRSQRQLWSEVHMAKTHTPPPGTQDTALAVGITISGGQASFSGDPRIVSPSGNLDLTGLPGGVQIFMVIETAGYCFYNDGSDSAADALYLAAKQSDKVKSTPLPAAFKDPALNPPYFNVLTLTSKNNDSKRYYYTLNFIDSKNNLLSWDPIIFNN